MNSTSVTTLDESMAYCVRLARRTGKTFFYTFLSLPRPMFRDMCVLYSFMRLTDDLGDDTTVPLEDRRTHLDAWQTQLRETLSGFHPSSFSLHPSLPALADLVARRQLPLSLLETVIEGVRSDLTPRVFQTFQELEAYCYQVAGAVGLCCIRIWGCHDDLATPASIDCGTAFQLTNILRDIQEDALMGRIYLPLEDLTRFGCTREDLIAGKLTPQFRELMRFQTDRAKSYYQRATGLTEYLETPGRRILSAMIAMYGSLLHEIEGRDFDVFGQRIRLSLTRKLTIAFRSFFVVQPRQSFQQK